MNSPSRRRAWLPLAVFAVCVGGPLVFAQPPGQRSGPPPGFGNPPGFGGPMGGMPAPPMIPPNSGQPPGFGGPMGGMPTQPMGGMPNQPNVPNMGGMPNVPNMGGMPNMPGMGGDTMVKVWTCEKCRNQWESNGTTPTSCPKCGVRFSHITDENGKVTRTTSGWLGSAKLWIFLAIIGVSIIAAIIKGIMAASAGGAKKKVKKKRKPMRRPRDDDDY